MAWNNTAALLSLLLRVIVASAFFLNAAAGGDSSLSDSTDDWRTNGISEADDATPSLVLPACAGRRKPIEARPPGSRPPQCARRCGRCTPCRLVYVAVPPAVALPATDAAEYYPEAWRCTCDGLLYVP